MKRIVLIITAFAITVNVYSQTLHDAPSNTGNGGYISSGNYGGTGSAAYFPSGLWANSSTSWLYGTVFFNGTLLDNASTPRWKINPTGTSWFNGGSVGIGTTNPNGQLQVNSTRPIIFKYNGGSGVYGSEIGFNAVLNTNLTPNRFIKLGGTNQQGGASIIVDNWGSMYFQTYNAGTESESTINYDPQITFLNNGSVGIGTTTPSAQMDIAGKIGGVDSRNFRVKYFQNDNLYVGGAELSGIAHVNGYWTALYAKQGNSSSAAFFDGNVGIGTATPNAKLSVNGEINMGNGWDRGLNLSQNYLSLGETEGSASTILGNNIKATDNVNSTVEVTKSIADGSNWLKINYNSGFTFHRIGANPTGTRVGENTGELFRITPTGNVGIGVTNPQYKLAVEGTIAAREVKVTAEAWSDFVFHPTYKLRTLNEVEQFIKTNNHLPEIPTETEVKQNGIGLGEMNAKLLQKIEELTLYMIEQQKVNEKQNQLIKELETKIEIIANKQ